MITGGSVSFLAAHRHFLSISLPRDHERVPASLVDRWQKFAIANPRTAESVGGAGETAGMSESPLVAAHRLLAQAVDAVSAAAAGAGDDELVSVLAVCEGAARRLDQVVVDAVAALERRGVFIDRGYSSAANALADLVGWERFEARRRVVAAEQVSPRLGLDGRRCRPGSRPPPRCSPPAGRGCGMWR
jgi:hypothetical protein